MIVCRSSPTFLWHEAGDEIGPLCTTLLHPSLKSLVFCRFMYLHQRSSLRFSCGALIAPPSPLNHSYRNVQRRLPQEQEYRVRPSRARGVPHRLRRTGGPQVARHAAGVRQQWR